jgi:hypothetical protein
VIDHERRKMILPLSTVARPTIKAVSAVSLNGVRRGSQDASMLLPARLRQACARDPQEWRHGPIEVPTMEA